MQYTINELQKKARSLRKTILNMCIKAGTGHVTSSFSCTELLVALYYGGILRYDNSNPQWQGRDRFILSKGQASPLIYAILADLAFFPSSKLDTFCQKNGMFGVHLQNDVPGVEITAGSLGHGLGIGAGMALAAKMDGKKYRTFVLLGDGECHEGSVWEAALFAGHHELDNLIAIVDRNYFCATGQTEDIVCLNPFDKKWASCGWDVVMINGHSFKEIFSSFKHIRSRHTKKPYIIIANTVKGKGVSFMENKVLWHGIAPHGEEAERAIKELEEG